MSVPVAGSAAATPSLGITPLTPAMRAAMTGRAWKPGCPVPLRDLVAIRVRYLGFDGTWHDGTIVAHHLVADDVVRIFSDLAKVRFPIRNVSPWEKYGPTVYAQDDVTVGFYCEKADDEPSTWSSHAYGIAIDINPLENPFYNAAGVWWPAEAAKNGPRDGARGKITQRSAAVRIFARYGWSWGGFFAGERDFMHFNKATFGGRGNPLERPYIATSLQYVPANRPELPDAAEKAK